MKLKIMATERREDFLRTGLAVSGYDLSNPFQFLPSVFNIFIVEGGAREGPGGGISRVGWRKPRETGKILGIVSNIIFCNRKGKERRGLYSGRAGIGKKRNGKWEVQIPTVPTPFIRKVYQFR